MYVSIMERKGIEKGRTEGIQLGRTEGMKLGRTEGMKLGRTEGMKLGEIRGRTETARKLLQMGLDPARVAEAASLTLEEVYALQAGPVQ